ncbi:MAG: peptide chain release factor N(5)-glutamine methyltransferase, partial [Candidatus Eisenbacteria sp.]|nr:peptide chain release factor N(5)-glutamine methyltransferase [Candidatus Eisenbacteria bacterium]
MATMTKTRTWTVLELINWSKGHLDEKGFDNTRLEVELLLSHALRLPRVELYVQFERQMNGGELAAFKALFKRRLTGEPVQYVTGTAAFMLGEFEVNSAVLIPRPETEALTEVVLRMLEGVSSAPAGSDATASSAPIVADIGTGSGVIATTVAMRVPAAVVYATDVSAAALEVAARNAERA